MINFTRLLLFTLLLLPFTYGFSQQNNRQLNLIIQNENGVLLEGATIEILNGEKLVKTGISDINGSALIQVTDLTPTDIRVSFSGYQARSIKIDPSKNEYRISLKAGSGELSEVRVTSKKPFIQRSQGKTIVNVDASITNTGTTVLEVLEKSPGILVDRNGGISMQGKTGVLVLIDDKPTYLPASEISNLLGSMSSSQVDQIELITNPSAKYDASGNAGIINIKTKKNKQKGFNGVLTSSFTQGVYPKNNNSLILNFRNGKFNTYLTYSLNYNEYFYDMYALRKKYDPVSGDLTSSLEQPTFNKGRGLNNTFKIGVDFSASAKTTIGILATGVTVDRKGFAHALATWKDGNMEVDSSITTDNKNEYDFKNAGLNFNLKHALNKSNDINADVDLLKYDIERDELFLNNNIYPTGRKDGTLGDLPSEIRIITFKTDHTYKFSSGKLESGFKTSRIETDNIANYQYYDGISWAPDPGKTNHFKYNENIHAVYSSYENKWKKFSLQAGLRYEMTRFDAHQVTSDSSFSRKYSGLFPSGYISYEIDSSNTISFTTGRRIDRPAFQRLNPFVNIINKYTHERGNPFILPQYTWNFELGHQYKDLLTTTVAYSFIRNYFSQIFLTEPEVFVYTQGNVGRMHNASVSLALQYSPWKFWSFTSQLTGNYKELIGFGNRDYRSTIRQVNFSMNNQFRLSSKYTAELSGFYTGRARNDIQEVLYPNGQVSIGLSRPVLKNKGTLKISARDIFYTVAMEGLTDFDHSTEYFIVKRDTRVGNISFTYRFGKAFKSNRRNSGSAADEMDRVGNGN